MDQSPSPEGLFLPKMLLLEGFLVPGEKGAQPCSFLPGRGPWSMGCAGQHPYMKERGWTPRLCLCAAGTSQLSALVMGPHLPPC